MTELTPLARACCVYVWPLVGLKAKETCETIDEENAYMNDAVARVVPYLLDTPDEILGLIWGVHPLEAAQRREAIRAALAEHTESV